MTTDIPITFTCQGKEYSGHFSQVMGAGSSTTLHLYINKYYCGGLRMGPDDWVFDATPKTEPFAELSDFFGNYIMLWHC